MKYWRAGAWVRVLALTIIPPLWWSQVAWASDGLAVLFANQPQPSQEGFIPVEQIPGFLQPDTTQPPASPLPATQTTPPPATITFQTSGGLQAKFEQDKITYIQREDGTQIAGAVFDEQGQLVKGTITLPDGSVVELDQRLVDKEVTPDGREISYQYKLAGLSQILATKLIGPQVIRTFTTDVQPVHPDQTTGATRDADGLLTSLTTALGDVYSYARVFSGDQLFTNLASLTTQNGDVFHYDNDVLTAAELADGTILRNLRVGTYHELEDADITLSDGTTLAMRHRLLTHVETPDLRFRDYEYVYDADGHVTQVLVHERAIVFRTPFTSEVDLAAYTIKPHLKDEDADHDAGKQPSAVLQDGDLILNPAGKGEVMLDGKEAFERLTPRMTLAVDFAVEDVEHTELEVLAVGKADHEDAEVEGPKRELGLVLHDGHFFLRRVEGKEFKDTKLDLTPELNRRYRLEWEFTPDATRLFLYHQGQPRPAQALVVSDVADWAPRLSIEAQHGPVLVDHVEVNRFHDATYARPALDPFYQDLPLTFRDRQSLDLDAISLQYDTATKHLLAYTRPNDALVSFRPDGWIASTQALDGRRSDWTYTVDAAGHLVQTKQITNGSISTFDAQGNLLKRIEENGALVTYRGTALDNILTADGKPAQIPLGSNYSGYLAGKRYVYTTDANHQALLTAIIDAFGNTYHLDAQQRITAIETLDHDVLSHIVLDAQGFIKDADIRLADGTLILQRDRLIQRVETPDLRFLDYTYLRDALQRITQVIVNQRQTIFHDEFDAFDAAAYDIDPPHGEALDDEDEKPHAKHPTFLVQDGALVLNPDAKGKVELTSVASYDRSTVFTITANIRLDLDHKAQLTIGVSGQAPKIKHDYDAQDEHGTSDDQDHGGDNGSSDQQEHGHGDDQRDKNTNNKDEQQGKGHEDPQPAHGQDDEHGHADQGDSDAQGHEHADDAQGQNTENDHGQSANQDHASDSEHGQVAEEQHDEDHADQKERVLALLVKGGQPVVRYRELRGFKEVPVALALDPATTYTVQFEFSDAFSRIYLYPIGTERPATPLFESHVTDWDPRFFVDAKNGSVTLDHLAVDRFTQHTFKEPNDDPFYQHLPLTYQNTIRKDIETVRVQYDDAGHVVQALKPDGTLVDYTDQRISKVTQPDGTVTLYRYTLDAHGQVTQTEVERNGLIRRYNSLGERFQVQDQNGSLLNYSGDQIVSIQTASGLFLDHLRFDASGQLQDAHIQFPDGNTKLYANGQLVGAILNDGTQLTYDAAGNIVHYVTPDNRPFDLSYATNTAGQQLLTLQNALKGETLLFQAGILAQKVDNLDVTHTYTYDDQGRIVHEIQRKGPDLLHDFRYAYEDGSFTVTDERGVVRRFDLATGKLLSLTTPTGDFYSHTILDATGLKRLVELQTQGQDPRVTFESYTDASGAVLQRVASFNDPANGFSRFHYAAANTNVLDFVERLDGSQARYELFTDASGATRQRLVSVTSSTGGVTRYTYASATALDLASVTAPDGTVVHYAAFTTATGAPAFRVATVEQASVLSTFHYLDGSSDRVDVIEESSGRKIVYEDYTNAAGEMLRRVARVEAPAGITQFAYADGASDHVAAVTLPDGTVVRYELFLGADFALHQRVAEVAPPAGLRQAYVYDDPTSTLPSAITQLDGTRISFERYTTSFGELRTRIASVHDGVTGETWTFAYAEATSDHLSMVTHSNGDVIRFETVGSLTRVASVTSVHGTVATYEYAASTSNELAAITLADGTRVEYESFLATIDQRPATRVARVLQHGEVVATYAYLAPDSDLISAIQFGAQEVRYESYTDVFGQPRQRISQIIESDGRFTVYHYLTQVTDNLEFIERPDGLNVFYETFADANGVTQQRVSKTVDRVTNVTETYTYTAPTSATIARVRRPDGTLLEYASYTLPSEEADQRISAVIAPDGARTTYAYATADSDLLASAARPDGTIVYYAQIAEHEGIRSYRVSAVEVPGAGTLTYAYADATATLPTTMTLRADERILHYEPLADGRYHLTSIEMPDASVTTYAYAPNGSLATITDPDGTIFAYESLPATSDQRLATVTSPNGETFTYAYADASTDVLASVTRADGTVLAYAPYTNAAGLTTQRVASVTDTAGAVQTYAYVAPEASVLERVQLADGTTVHYETYGVTNDAFRVSQVAFADGTIETYHYVATDGETLAFVERAPPGEPPVQLDPADPSFTNHNLDTIYLSQAGSRITLEDRGPDVPQAMITRTDVRETLLPTTPADENRVAVFQAIIPGARQDADPFTHLNVIPLLPQAQLLDPAAQVTALNFPTLGDGHLALPSFGTAQAFTPEAVTSLFYDEQGNLSRVQIGAGTTTYFANLLPTHVDDGSGARLVDFAYDTQNRLEQITLTDARKKLLDLTAMLRAKTQAEHDAALAKLAADADKARADVNTQLQSGLAQLDAERSRLRSLSNADISQAMADVNNAETNLRRDAANALAQIDSQVASGTQQIETKTTQTLADVDSFERTALGEIRIQESAPLISFYYNELLGRSPGTDELTQWLTTARADHTILGTEVRPVLENSAELAARKTEIAALQTDIRAQLESYVFGTDADRAALLHRLGLAADQVVPISRAELTRLLSLLYTQSPHFIRSASDPLAELLIQEQALPNRHQLTADLILTDVFTGAITFETQGDVEISVRGLVKAAANQGVPLFGVRASYDQLLQEPRSFMALIDRNHFVRVTAVTAETVTYFDIDLGPNGEAKTISRVEFEQRFTGVIVTPNKPQDQTRILTEAEAKLFTGAKKGCKGGGGIWIMIAVALLQFIPVIGNILGSIVGTFSASLGAAIAHIGQVVGSFLNPANLLSKAFTGLSKLPVIGSFADKAVSIGQALGTKVQGAFQWANSIGTKFFNNQPFALMNTVLEKTLETNLGQLVFDTGVNLGVSKGLHALGCDSPICEVAAAYVAGNITGGAHALGPKATLSQILKSAEAEARRLTAIQTIRLLGEEAGLDPALAGVLSIAGGDLSSLGQLSADQTIQQIKQISRRLVGDLAFVGVQKVGDELGLDPRISYLAGMPVRAGLVGYLGTGGTVDAMLKEIKDGVLSGATSLALDFAGEKAGLDPLETALASRTLTALISAAFNQQFNLWQAVVGAVGQSVDRLLGEAKQVLPAPTLPDPKDARFRDPSGQFNQVRFDEAMADYRRAWDAYNHSQSVYLAKVVSFSQIVEERGVENAFEEYATSIFQQDAIDEIYRLGGILSLLTGRATILHPGDMEYPARFGENVVKRIKVTDHDVLYLNAATGVPMGRDVIGAGYTIRELGIYGIGPDGRWLLVDGHKEVELAPQVKATVTYALGQQVGVFFDDQSKRQLAMLGAGSLLMDATGTPLAGELTVKSSGVKVVFKDGLATNLIVPSAEQVNIQMDLLTRSLKQLSREEFGRMFSIAVMNGVWNRDQVGFPPGYLEGYKNTVAKLLGVNANSVVVLPLYERGDPLKDVASWLFDLFGSNLVTDKVIQELETQQLLHGIPPEGLTVVAYSGSFQPLLKALGERDFNVNTIVAVGTQTVFGTLGIGRIESKHLQRIISIQGTLDPSRIVMPDAFTRSDGTKIEVLNIVLPGIGHGYFADQPSGNLRQDLLATDLSLVSTAFLAILATQGVPGKNPEVFLKDLKLQPDENGTFHINLEDAALIQALLDFLASQGQ